MRIFTQRTFAQKILTKDVALTLMNLILRGESSIVYHAVATIIM